MTPEQLAKIIDPQPIEGDVIISAGPLLGLGDWSLYTTLPERFAALGHNVYLDKDSQTSNPEIYELFLKNPHIKDLTDKKPNAGQIRQGLFYETANRLPGYRCIEAMERAHALPPPYGIAPKFYYTPKPFHIDLKNIVLMDFSAVSSKIGQRGLQECVKMMNGKFKNPYYLQVIHAKHVALHTPEIAGSGYQVSSIFEYIDMLNACRGWIGSEAGGQALASSVRGEHGVFDENAKPEIVCTITPQTYNSRAYTFANIDYRVTSDCDTSSDYWQPLEVQAHQYNNLCKIRAIEMEERLAGR